MSGLRGGFKGAVHGKPSKGRRAIGWLPVLLVIVALMVLIRRLGLF